MRVLAISKLPLLLKPFALSLLLSLSVVLLLLASQTPLRRSPSAAAHPPPASSGAVSGGGGGGGGGIRIRSGYTSYEAYIQHQLNKTLNPNLRKIWTTRDWDRKVRVFARFFDSLKRRGLLAESWRALSIGARVGQEVAALKLVGVNDSIGIDLVPRPPLVVEGDFHAQPFPNATFDFEFSNVFDHALYPWKFVGEVERTLRPGGICVLHVTVRHRTDKYSANDLYSLDPLVEMFRESELVESRSIDGFGLDTEVVFRKKMKQQSRRS
ncbi:hypothetical protein EUGRSUZ_B00164 [Eucalyptus grandis]|uniref:Methyltransferase type 11 domain-containing protein n=2 Tax=Eucalyptus grandis TaxID=71139 RepID=A0A059CXL9_EUCGR|nr:hypothetical protein EUGRSUZ_B00164 [Eucalyptus grandis]